jgi:ribosomal protein S18 acetylase RimI-like enzyme
LPFVLHTLYIYEDDHKSAVFQVAYLEQFAISEAWRGSGLAQKMLREAEDLARTRGKVSLF